MNKQPVLYMQTDARWKNLPYRVKGETATIGGSGCGPTCAAMVISTLTGKTVTPVDTCKWSVDHGYKALNQGTYFGYFPAQFKVYGIECTRLTPASIYHKPSSPYHKQAFDLLKKGNYIIACMGKGTWTSSGHFVLVWWHQGKVYINDPASTKQNRVRGDYNTFINEVKLYWSVPTTLKPAQPEKKEEEEDMTEAQVIQLLEKKFPDLLEKAEKERAKKPATGASWASVPFKEAIKEGITDGTRPQSYATREEVAIMLNRAKKGQ